MHHILCIEVILEEKTNEEGGEEKKKEGRGYQEILVICKTL